MRSRFAAFAAALLLSLATAVSANSLDKPAVPAGESDSIFVLDAYGNLEPIAVRRHGAFLKADPTDGTPGRFNSEANATLKDGHGKVNLIFGRRVVATVKVTVADGSATVKIPASLHLGGNVEALASPTLGGSAAGVRRAPTQTERAAALALAAAKLGTVASRLEVGNLTAIDLGAGVAFAGNVNLRGSGTPRKDKRMFFVAERASGALALTLVNAETIAVTEPLLEEVKEMFVDAIDIDGKPSIVTRQVGYDAHTYTIYARNGNGWKAIYSGGGVAL